MIDKYFSEKQTCAAAFFGGPIPESISEKIPSIAFTSLYTLIVYILYQYRLRDQIESRITSKENKRSNWSVAGLTVLGLIINLVLIVSFAMAEPAFPGEKFEYGNKKHEIFFDEGQVRNVDIQKVGRVLTEFGYFTPDMKMQVKIEKEDERLVLLLPVTKSLWEDSEVLADLNYLRSLLAIETQREFSLKLIDYDLSGNELSKDI